MLKVIEISTDLIKEYENNPRFNDNAIDKVAESIKKFGFKVPIIIDKDNVIVTGHTRIKAAKKLGLKKVPCIIATDLTSEQIKAFRLADNKVAEYSTWDEYKLYNELLELKVVNFDIETFGFDTKDIDTSNANIDEIKNKFESETDSDDEKENPYTMKIDIPQYQITGECPKLSELVDANKANELIDEIYNSNISDDIKKFLKFAAYRHLTFSYDKIAEYYAHADKEVQLLMEKSALVLIDFNDAIKYGYAQLSEAISKLYEEDVANNET